jgi:CBS domain-containing protein
MNTGAISYRVADFLKQHPPFQGMEEADLVALAGRGRVKFHEADEFLCWQASSFSPYLFVIQQGTVSLWDETSGTGQLRDILGVGDIVGVERFLGDETYRYSAKSTSEVVVYALNAADIVPLLEKYPQAARYIDAQGGAGYQALEQRRGVHRLFVADLASDGALLRCAPGTSVRDAVRTMRGAGAGAIVIGNEARIVGLVTADEFLAWMTEGGDCSSAVEKVPCSDLLTFPPDTEVSDCVVRMAELGAQVAAITSDGSASGTLQRLVHERDLVAAFGDHPVELIHYVAHARDSATLRRLHLRLRAFVLDHLTEPAALDWLARLCHEFNAAVLRRLIELKGFERNGCCWCFYGSAGRRELLTAAMPGIAILCSDHGISGPLSEMLDSIERSYVACGYAPPASLFPPTFRAAHLEDWLGRFSAWVQNPVMSHAQVSLRFFDLRPVHGTHAMWHELRKHVGGLVQAEPSFVEIIAHDCLANLPPLTFFRDLVVDASGRQVDTFQLEQTALRPLVDVARVFGIAAKFVLGASTVERLERARAFLPAHEAVFRAAAETVRKVLFHQARIGIRMGSDGAKLPPSMLSRHDQQELKSGFRPILELLEFTADRTWVSKDGDQG